MTEDDFLRIRWPEIFSVVFTDGTSLVLARGKDGVAFCPPGDDPAGRGFITALDHQAHALGRACYLDTIERIVSQAGQALWTARR
jgi:hypothetical protein